MVRVARAGRSLNLVQLADVARELAMLGLSVVNTAHVGNSWRNRDRVQKAYDPEMLNTEDRTVEARQLEEAGCFCCGNV
nr:unnamed protein product [Fasciola hepatica]